MKYSVTAHSAFEGKRITLTITAKDEAEARKFAREGGATGRITVKPVQR